MSENPSGKRPIRILIADDHQLVREGLYCLMKTQADLEVVGEAEDGVEALRLVNALRPDILLLDLDMPRLGGLEVARRMQDAVSETKIVVLSGFPVETHASQAREAGASGYVQKGRAGAEVLNAIRAARDGCGFWSQVPNRPSFPPPRGSGPMGTA